MHKFLKNKIIETIKILGLPEVEPEIEIPKNEAFGDLSTPIAMEIAKKLKTPPRTIAQDIIQSINKSSFESVELAGPGFINFKFKNDFVFSELENLLKLGELFFTQNIGNGKKIQIEFVSANPTGPLHLGHGRGAALGAALANILKEAGYNVFTEYYINDAGKQVEILGLSVYIALQNLFGKNLKMPEECYKGEYINEIAKELYDLYGNSLQNKEFDEIADFLIDFSYKKMLNEIKKDLDDFGVNFDNWISERKLYHTGEVQRAILKLKELGFIYEKDGALWFHSTAFGDDKDRVIVKSDGTYTYFASDIAYHKNKIERGFDELINIWGADHHGYIQRVKAAVQALGMTASQIKILLVQMVNLLREGKPVQMSKRAGTFVTLRELIDEIGADTTKFIFLTRRHDSHLEFDIEIAKKQSHENPVYYVQYAHARINSIFVKAQGEPERFSGELFNEDELRIIKKVLIYPMIFELSVQMREPHRITFYLQELAALFHSYYHKYRVISENDELTETRLSLCKAIMLVLRHGLRMLGVKAPEKM
ncbi:arginine--tRNA ligase [Thermodesulfovibrio yellowstonii]|uniref:arginine--tRNA ligase n=1 Tax=Thermodesulfovibrio yellowstonii TaxID=28262 RepID=UPI0024B321D3|nr:arginine--tRNA ligase [Thermodesulfovibrio yellowstonii]MDI6864277.1 arginine--tRNA ligase [Thermodesulfovibrio yellowstonii]